MRSSTAISWTRCVLAFGLLGACGDSTPGAPATLSPTVVTATPSAVPGVVLVKVTRSPVAPVAIYGGVLAGSQVDALSAVAALGASYQGLAFELDYSVKGDAKRAFGFDRWHRFAFDPEVDLTALVEQIRAIAGIEDAAPDSIGHGATIPPDDTHYASRQWHLENTGANPGQAGADIDAERGWAVTTGSDTLTLAVLDSGIDSDHPEFAGRLGAGYDFVNEDADPEDDESHGTYCAGIAAGNASNGFGVAGVDWAVKIMPVKVLDATNSGTTTDLIEGLTFATDNGADVISMSLINYSCTYNPLRDALQYARDGGAVVISAAGNGGFGDADVSGPGCWPQTLSIGATTNQDGRANFSGTGAALDVTAPGSAVATVRYDSSGDLYTSFSGTSAACPVVAGAATLMLATDPTLDHDTIAAIVKLTADDQVGPDTEDLQGRDDSFGWGRINMGDALEALPLGALSLGRGPRVGRASEVVRFYVVVTSAQPPGDVNVVLSGGSDGAYAMGPATVALGSMTDGDPTNGELYEVATLLPAGQYTYHFEADIGGSPERDPVVGEYDGLEILETSTDDYAIAEDAAASSTALGSIADTTAGDQVGYGLQEVSSTGGRPQNRYSTFEHTFEFNVLGGASVDVHLVARRIDSAPDADDFNVYYSTDGGQEVLMTTIASDKYPSAPFIYALPASTSGPVYITFRDTDSGAGNQDNDRLDIDAMFIRSSGSVSSCSTPPTTAFTSAITSGSAPLTVGFDDASTGDAPTAWTWSFGDGGASSESSPTYTYSDPGIYTVALTTSNACGEDTLTKVDLITVTQPPGSATMWVDSVMVDRLKANGPNYQGRAIVTVVDVNGQPVSGATVTASYTGPNSGTAAATTDGTGEAELVSKKTKSGLGSSWCFEVIDVDAAGYDYDAAQNVESAGCE